MRKIAANYICLPGFPLVKNGYVILEQGRVKDVVDTGGRIREIQGLEFYGGLIVAAYVAAYAACGYGAQASYGTAQQIYETFSL